MTPEAEAAIDTISTQLGQTQPFRSNVQVKTHEKADGTIVLSVQTKWGYGVRYQTTEAEITSNSVFIVQQLFTLALSEAGERYQDARLALSNLMQTTFKEG